MLLQYEIEEIVGMPVGYFRCCSEVEALYQSERNGPYGFGKERTYFTGTITKETYEFCTEESIPLLYDFSVETKEYSCGALHYAISRTKREILKEWKFCYER